MRGGSKKLSRGPVDLIDEALHLLRRLPVTILVFYYLGAIPFVLVFLFFWADMSQGPLAPQRVAEAAFGAGVAYIWMKFWHAFFCSRMREWVTGEEQRKWTAGTAWRVLAAQGFLQPPGLLLKPLSLAVPFLFVPVYSFFSIITAEGARYESAAKLFARASSQSFSSVRELSQVVFLLLLFGVFVLVNFITLIISVPYLLQLLFAIDTDFMRTGWSAGNSTFLVSALALTYMVIDPLFKAMFTLRSYYQEARGTGEDLRVELNREIRRKSLSSPAMILLLACLFGGLVLPAPAAAGGEPEGERTRPALSIEDLDRRVDGVLSRRAFDWRLPKPPVADDEEAGLLRRFVDTIGAGVGEVWAKAGRTAGRLMNWLVDLLVSGAREPGEEGSPRDWATGLRILVILAGAILLALAGWLLWQGWRKRRRVERPAMEPVLQARPDLEDENVSADALPSDEWSRMAQDCKARGELRLALRAWYMASLASLAEARLVVPGKAKSNREYQEELLRRAHDQKSRVEAFRQNCRVYEQAWYGMYAVDSDMLTRFEMNQKQIKHYEEIPAR